MLVVLVYNFAAVGPCHLKLTCVEKIKFGNTDELVKNLNTDEVLRVYVRQLPLFLSQWLTGRFASVVQT